MECVLDIQNVAFVDTTIRTSWQYREFRNLIRVFSRKTNIKPPQIVEIYVEGPVEIEKFQNSLLSGINGCFTSCRIARVEKHYVRNISPVGSIKVYAGTLNGGII